MSRQPLHSIFWSFLRIGAGAFGGGMAALPVFEAELATRRRWLTPHDVAETYAISQSVPGVIIVNFAVLAGLLLHLKRAGFSPVLILTQGPQGGAARQLGVPVAVVPYEAEVGDLAQLGQGGRSG